MKKSAEGQVGHLLFTNDEYIFRVYSDDKKSFVDYELKAEDIKIKIVDNYVALEDTDDGQHSITWSDQTLGR